MFSVFFKNVEFVDDSIAATDSSHELVSHDQTDFLVDDFASWHVDRNHGALIGVLLLRTRARERDAEPEFLHFLRRSNANDPVVE